MRLVLFFVLFVIAACPAIAQPAIGNASDADRESLIKKYLTDTLDAAAKIKELRLQASHLKDKSPAAPGAIIRYQIAFALVPYAYGDPYSVFKLYADYSDLLKTTGVKDLYIDYAKRSFLLNEQLPKNSLQQTDAYNTLGNIAGFYMEERQYGSALFYYQKSLAQAYKITDTRIWVSAAYNNIGMMMAMMKNYPQAAIYYHLADSVLPAITRGDSLMIGSITDNRAQLAVTTGDWGRAGQLYQANLKCYTNLQETERQFQALCGLFNVAMGQNNQAEASQYYQSLRQRLAAAPNKIGASRTLDYYRLLQQYCLRQGDYVTLNQIKDKERAYTDSLAANEKKHQADILRGLAFSQVYKSQQDIKAYQQQLAMTRSNTRKTAVIAVLLICLLGAGLLFYRSRNKVLKVKKQLADAELANRQLEIDKVQMELQYRQKDLSGLALHLSSLKDTNTEMLERLADIKTKKSAEQASAIHQLARESGVKVQLQEKNTFIQENVDKLSNAFNDRLLQNWPGLSKGEIELCGFIRLNLGNKEIGALKNISPDSVKKARTRLRKKLGVMPEENLVLVLEAV